MSTTASKPDVHPPLAPHEQASLIRRGRRLEYLTVGYNVTEAVISITAGAAAGSIALLGFGIDAVIEASSGLILLWRLQHGERGERREALALRFVGVSLMLLAGYVIIDSLRALWTSDRPDETPIGVAITFVSLLIMPWIARAKRRVAASLNSQALHADSRQTALCAYLSAIVLTGTGLNALFGWWWADPLAALVMAPIIIKEGLEALQGKTCTDCHAH